MEASARQTKADDRLREADARLAEADERLPKSIEWIRDRLTCVAAVQITETDLALHRGNEFRCARRSLGEEEAMT